MKKHITRLGVRTASAVAAMVFVANAAWALEPFKVQDIRVEGLQRVEPGTIFASMPLRVGDDYNDDKGAAAIRALFALGLFKDVRGTAFMVPRGWKPGADWSEQDSRTVDTPGKVEAHKDPYAMEETPSSGGSCATGVHPDRLLEVVHQADACGGVQIAAAEHLHAGLHILHRLGVTGRGDHHRLK